VTATTQYYPTGARARGAVDRTAAVHRVITAMRERIDSPLSLDEMAGIAYLSPFYFNRVFRQQTGVPPGRFHTALRMAAAKRLLVTTELSVTDVCLEVGYQSLGTFTTHFRELVGVSPRELRRLAQDPPAVPTDWEEAFRSADSSVAGDPETGEHANGGAPARTVEVTGTVVCADPEPGRLVFVGLFRHPYPQGLPAACTALTSDGAYRLKTAADEPVHAAAAAFPRREDLCSYLLADCESLLVASSAAVVPLARGATARRDLVLRPPRTTDPPILLALPLLLALRIAARQEPTRRLVEINS
jgi:AraC-like DNA-binding protein